MGWLHHTMALGLLSLTEQKKPAELGTMFEWICKHMFGLSLLTSISHNSDFVAIKDYLHNLVHFAELYFPTVHMNGLAWL